MLNPIEGVGVLALPLRAAGALEDQESDCVRASRCLCELLGDSGSRLLVKPRAARAHAVTSALWPAHKECLNQRLAGGIADVSGQDLVQKRLKLIVNHNILCSELSISVHM
jgi:hypothetical protein